MSATSLADALAQCRAAGVDLRRDGKGMSDCIALMAPFCVGGTSSVRADTSQQLPFCASSEISPAKAAAELRDAQIKQAALALEHPSPWFWIVGGVAVAGLAFVAWRG